ncbi:MAG: methyltransferase [Anaerolineales bacterium]|nr:methyltransferase [Chloroflexota bacterium]MBL6979870.1 methyltransferase [Anaerolineales bacterium]
MPSQIVLSHYQAIQLTEAKGSESTVQISPDLGLSKIAVELTDGDVTFSADEKLSWDVVAEIAENENNCFIIDNGSATIVRAFSETFERVYTLFPTASAPTMLVSGIPMHRIKGIDPWRDSQSKIKTLGRISGHILDTTTGLGYTAILAAEREARVTTVELDPAAQIIARCNPWSRALFDNPKITQIIGDSNDEIETFADGFFNGIIHDPPMFSLAGELYSLAFYEQAYRVLKSRGRMFHYIGNPESKSGSRVTRGVVQRLKKAGFSRVVPQPDAFGVLASK